MMTVSWNRLCIHQKKLMWPFQDAQQKYMFHQGECLSIDASPTALEACISECIMCMLYGNPTGKLKERLWL